MVQIPEYETIKLEIRKGICYLIMDRPYVHNAFNADMVSDMLDALKIVKSAGNEIRVLVLTGEGRSFCAGADVNWLKEIKDQSYEANIRESLEMSDLMFSLYSLPVPTIANVNGTTMGCGIGFICACDIVVASENAIFAVNDVKLGVSPAVAAPYIMRKIGESHSLNYCLLGEPFDAKTAFRIGMVNKVVAHVELENAVDELCTQLMTSGPKALSITKDVLSKIPLMTFSEARVYTAEIIGKQRISEEAQDGMASFIKKEKPSWYPKK